jgi:hypothetical protein
VADFCAVESGVYGVRFRRFFGTWLEGRRPGGGPHKAVAVPVHPRLSTQQGSPGFSRIGRSEGSTESGSPSPRPRSGEPCRFLSLQRWVMGNGGQRQLPMRLTSPHKSCTRAIPDSEWPSLGSIIDSHKLAARSWRARQAVPTASRSEITLHESPSAHIDATCLASPAVWGRPNFLPIGRASRRPARTRS